MNEEQTPSSPAPSTPEAASTSDHAGTADAPENAAASAVPDTHAGSVLLLANTMQRYALPTAGIAAALAIVVSAVLVGWTGALGALVGAVVAAASCLATLVIMRRSAASSPFVVMGVALGGFAVKMVVLFVVMLALRGVDALHPKALAFTMMGIIVVWAAAEVRAFQKTKIPTIIPASDGS